MRNKTIILVLSLLTIATQVHAVEVFFSPGLDCENHIIEAIQSSRLEVSAVVYNINNPRILNALIEAHKRGVKVKILTDRSQAESASSGILKLMSAGIDLRVHSRHKLEHNAFGVFDDKTAVNGSYNWSEAASEANSENCALLPEANAVKAYKQRFKDLWNLNKETESQAYLVKIISYKSKTHTDEDLGQN